MSLYSPEGNRNQSLVHDAKHPGEILPQTGFLSAGIIVDVYAIDRQDTNGNPLNVPGAYLTYTVQLAPTGVFIHNVPTTMNSGHTKFVSNTLASNDLGHQNSEETPYVIGQPVLVGFLYNSNFNAIILGPASSQINGSNASPGGSGVYPLDQQTTGPSLALDPTTGASPGDYTYPQKQGVFQGTSWKIDKNGNTLLNINTGKKLTIQLGGIDLCVVKPAANSDGYEIDLGLDGETQPTVLGNVLNTYLTNFVTLAFNTHTHLFPATGGAPTSEPVVPATPPSGITTTIVKVQ